MELLLLVLVLSTTGVLPIVRDVRTGVRLARSHHRGSEQPMSK
jgi:hypothetical protein